MLEIPECFIGGSIYNIGKIVEEGEEHFIALEITIQDTGCGISEEGLKKLFIDFGKLDENSKRNK